MTKKEKLNEAYQLISGQLAYLPNKKWKTFILYGQDFKFIRNKNILKQVSKFKMTLDYSLSLYELHKPLGPIQEVHFLSLAQIIGCICEAMLRDLLYFKISNISDGSLSNSIKKNFERPQLRDLLEFFSTIFSQEDKVYLGNITKLRNTIHINTDSDYIRYIQDTGHLVVEHMEDDFWGGTLTKKEVNVQKLINEFDKFCVRFNNYY